MRRRITSEERKRILNKFGRRCAYCGCEIGIKSMQVDHIVPLCKGGADDIDNMAPSCRSCNHFKGGSTLESFRERVERWPDVLARDSVTYRNAVRFGLVKPNPQKVKFYFEKWNEQEGLE